MKATMTSLPEPLSIEELRRALDAGLEPDFLFFWGHTGRGAPVGKECFSQWYPAAFAVDGVTFPTAEHYMMHRKAVLFGDVQTAETILAAAGPDEAKALGRRVRDFDDERWKRARWSIVVAGNLQKFSQNQAAREFLLGTKARVLVEASPRDTVWGIGLGASSPDAQDVGKWRGLNLLGFALMQVRRELRDAQGAR